MAQYQDFLSKQSEEVVTIIEELSTVFIDYPDVEMKMRYRIPFYFRKSWICYLNPLKSGGVELAFLRAMELEHLWHLLDFKDRSQVAGIELKVDSSLDLELINELFAEAYHLDDTVAYQSKRT